MKQRFLQIAFFLANLASAAAYSPAPVGLIVKNHMPQTFSVVLDRQRVATQVNTFQFDGLTPGRHRVKLINDHFLSYGYNNGSTLYDSWIELQPGETMTLDIQPNGMVYASSYIAPCAPVVTYRQMPRPSSCNVKPAPLCNTSDNNYYDNHTYAPPAPAFYGMSPDMFYSLKQAVNNRSFDSTKRELLTSALKNNQVTAAQLYELLNLLDFDSSKVEIAKIGYASVVDKQNFFKVYDVFSFDSSISELQRYIG